MAIVCYLKWRLFTLTTHNFQLPTFNWPWYVLSLLSTVLAMKTKENSFTLPFVFLLIEAVFFRLYTKRQWAALIPFLATLLIIPFSRIDAKVNAFGDVAAGFAQETTEISRWSYLLTQFRVIVTYIQLLFLPIHQNFDYDYPIYHSLLDLPVLLSFLFLSSLFILSVYLLFNSKLKTQNSKLISFGILWFFLTLSIESSIIPIRDVIFEHRVYLPSVGFFLAMLVGIQKGLDRFSVRDVIVRCVFVLVLVVLSLAAYQRNGIWKGEASLWQDVVRKAPGKARAHNNLGLGYYDVQRLEDAVQEYQTALKLKPDLVEAHDNLGVVYKDLGRLDEAIQEYQRALKLKPDDAEVHNNLGIIFAEQGRLEEAIQEFQTAIKLNTNHYIAHSNLGRAYASQGRLKEAAQEYHIGIHLKPGDADAHNNLGNIYADQREIGKALEEYQAVLRLAPNHVEAHYNLGAVYERMGQRKEARKHYEQALQIKPDFLPARKALESLTQ